MMQQVLITFKQMAEQAMQAAKRMQQNNLEK